MVILHNTIPNLSLFSKNDQNISLFIHPLRRLFETLLYSRNSKSFMTSIQFIHGLFYYLILTFSMRHIQLNSNIFIALNLLQGIAHFRVYCLKKAEFLHYYSEALIHLFFFISDVSFSKFFNLFYVLLYIYIARKQKIKIPGIKSSS